MKTYYKITEKKRIAILFAMCWIVYFSTYLGRLNYSASLAEIVRAEGFLKSEAGLIGTGFFLCYGAGQLISGFLGDRLSPKWMIFGGMTASACANAAMAFLHHPESMAIIWGINGIVQAFIWSPMMRLMFDYLKTETRMKACLYLNSTVPIGTVTAYGMTALLLSLGNWRRIFFLPAVLLLAVAVLWLIVIGRVERYALLHGEKEEIDVESVTNRKSSSGKEMDTSWKGLLFHTGLLLLMGALVIQGTLKDGVTTWIPTYISETYGLGSITAILSTMLIPLFNLVGVYLASVVNTRIGKGEIRTAGIFYLVCTLALLVLWGSTGKSFVLSLIMLAVSTTAMMAVNTMLIAVYPSRFGTIGKASSVSGVLNSSVYIGGAISTYGIGALSVSIGWSKTIFLWAAGAMLAAALCFILLKKNKERRTI